MNRLTHQKPLRFVARCKRYIQTKQQCQGLSVFVLRLSHLTAINWTSEEIFSKFDRSYLPRITLWRFLHEIPRPVPYQIPEMFPTMNFQNFNQTRRIQKFSWFENAFTLFSKVASSPSVLLMGMAKSAIGFPNFFYYHRA